MMKMALRLVEVLERHRPLADADRLGERRAARLVAHVRAVGQVVRAELPNEKLIEKRRLVARAPGRVKNRFVRRGERVQLGGDQRERVLPGDRLVMRRALRGRSIGCVSRPSSPSSWSDMLASSGSSAGLTHPMLLRRGATHYEPTSWDDAFALIASELQRVASPDKPSTRGRAETSNEARFCINCSLGSSGPMTCPKLLEHVPRVKRHRR